MKKFYFICFLAVLLLIPFTYTMGAMTRGTMGEQGGQQHMGSGMMGGQQRQMGHGGAMMQGHEIMGGMMQDMNRMTGLMQKMTDVMRRTTDTARMGQMSDIMKDMSEHMGNMSRIMSRGSVSQKEMEELHQQMLETQKRFDMK
ncbi:MAG: hypothetical protein ABFR82_12425 [Nitrospirota bacterium]